MEVPVREDGEAAPGVERGRGGGEGVAPGRGADVDEEGLVQGPAGGVGAVVVDEAGGGGGGGAGHRVPHVSVLFFCVEGGVEDDGLRFCRGEV